jgi:hypothetical protein
VKPYTLKAFDQQPANLVVRDTFGIARVDGGASNPKILTEARLRLRHLRSRSTLYIFGIDLRALIVAMILCHHLIQRANHRFRIVTCISCSWIRITRAMTEKCEKNKHEIQPSITGALANP